MNDLATLLVAIGASAGTTALIIALLRAGGPLISRMFGTVLRTRAELDADRDRIISNLRQEIDDWKRRTEEAERRADVAEQKTTELSQQLDRLNAFVDQLLSRLGTTRQQIEDGEPWPFQRRLRH